MTEERAPAELEALRRAPLPAEPLAKSAARRAASWPGFQAAFERARAEPVRAARPSHETAVGLVVAAALAACGLLLFGRGATSPPTGVSTVTVPIAGPATVADIVVESGEATVRLANGIDVTAAIDARLTFDELEPRVDLTLGVARFVVPKLPAPQQFIVDTPDARVVVHGTEFVVSVRLDDELGGTVTSVAVREGIVAVHHPGGEMSLGAGESWSSVPQVAPAPTSSASSVSPPASTAASVAPPSSKPSQPPASTLAEENALFEKAMAARRSGDDAEVVRLLDLHRRRYPASPLAQVVSRERQRALERLR